MATYCVTLPVTGFCVVEVEAENADDAINKAMDNVTNDDLETWETHREITRGNVCYAEVNEAHAELVG
jgi:hypothetical protein